jgi:hypothetical protein
LGINHFQDSRNNWVTTSNKHFSFFLTLTYEQTKLAAPITEEQKLPKTQSIKTEQPKLSAFFFLNKDDQNKNFRAPKPAD